MSLGNMSGGEMMGAGAFAFMAFKTLIDAVLKILKQISPNKTSPVTIPDAREIEYKANMAGVLDECRKLLEKMNDKGDERAKQLDDIHGIANRDHRNIGQIQTDMRTLTTQIASGDFCNFQHKQGVN